VIASRGCDQVQDQLAVFLLVKRDGERRDAPRALRIAERLVAKTDADLPKETTHSSPPTALPIC